MEIGFEGAPVTRALALVTLSFSLLFDASSLSMQLPSLFRGQIWVRMSSSLRSFYDCFIILEDSDLTPALLQLL